MLQFTAGYQVLEDAVGTLGFLPDGRLYCSTVDVTDDAVADPDEYEDGEGDLVGVLKIWHPQRGVLKSRRKFDYGCDLAVSDDGRWIAWGGDYGRLCLIDTDGYHKERVLQVDDMSATDQPERIACGLSRDEFVFRLKKSWWRWTIQSEIAAPFPEVPFNGILAISADKQRFATVESSESNDIKDQIHWWDLDQGQSIVSVTSHDNDTRKIVWHPSKPLLAAWSWWNGGFSVWDFSTVAAPRLLLAEKGECADLVFLHDHYVVTCHDTGAIKVWDLDSGQLVAKANSAELGELKLIEEPDQVIITEDRPGVCALAVSADGRTLAAGTISGVVMLFEVNEL